GFRFGDAEWYYQSGRDPRHDDEAVGFVLLAHTVRAAIEDGMREYRFLLGDEPYKLRFTSEDPGDSTVLVPTGTLGRLVLGAAGARRAARSVLASSLNRSRRLGSASGCSPP
ncbi:MAG: GNAT family N-acetyltransferase, partial [Solirubrobacteraceae bacterium]